MCDQDVKTKSLPEKAFEWLGFVVVVTIFLLVITTVLMPHRVRSYYLSPDANNGMAACVSSDVEWAPDSRVYCTNDPRQAIEDVKALNAELR